MTRSSFQAWEAGSVTGPHPNCFDNLAGPLAEFGVPSATVTIAFNFFMNVVIGPDGRLGIGPPASAAGQGITFDAERDVIVAVTSCAAPGANAGGARRYASTWRLAR